MEPENYLILLKTIIQIALMIDQRVSEGIELDFFGEKALTTTMPAQLVKNLVVKLCLYILKE